LEENAVFQEAILLAEKWHCPLIKTSATANKGCMAALQVIIREMQRLETFGITPAE